MIYPVSVELIEEEKAYGFYIDADSPEEAAKKALKLKKIVKDVEKLTLELDMRGEGEIGYCASNDEEIYISVMLP
jgi:hypothetical protein